MLQLFWKAVLFSQMSAVASNLTVHHYELPRYPKGELSCQAEAEALAVRLKEQTGVGIVGAEGHHEAARECRLAVRYEAPSALPLISTHPERDPVEGGERWNYPSLPDCLGDMLAQAPLFEDETGLRPLVAYCYDATWALSTRTYVLRIESLGRPKRRPYRFEMPRGAQQQGALNELVASALQNRGATVFRIAASADPLTEAATDVIHYYADGWSGLSKLGTRDGDLRYGTVEECESQLPFVEDAMSATGVEKLAAVCALDRPWTPRKEARLAALYFARHAALNVYTKPSVDYPTMQACHDDRARAIAEFKKTTPADVRAALCALHQDFLQRAYRTIFLVP